MGWKATGQPTVRKQRDKWVVRVDGIDTETGKHRPRQVGTYASQRSALRGARSVSVQERVATRDTVSWLVRRYVASRSDVTVKAREQYEWAIPHIEAGLGAIRLDRLDREDVARWLEDLAAAGRLSWRSVQICRTVLRAALADAVEEGLLGRSPAARVPMPRAVAKPPKEKEVDAWTDEQVAHFLSVSADHRWAVAFRLGVLYGLRRSEALALKWNDLDTADGTLRIDEGLVAVSKGAVWSEAKNARSRRVIPLDDETLRALARHRKEQAEERLVAGSKWEDHDLIIATHVGRPVMPRSLDRALEVLIEKVDLPRLTSHGLRHTAATHMVRGARDVGELRAVADVLGHSPDMLMKVYAHAMPESTRAVADRIGARAIAPADG
ncbi:MAG TPA: site-specific integrase [Acidimicrobiales bacterium]|nr:site-specific integrase [Acidimicrobiales bacterium]